MSNFVTKQDLKGELNTFGAKLFKYFNKEFKAIHTDFEQLRGEFGGLQTTVDAYAGQVEIYHHESVARDAQVDRIQRWVEKIAQKTGVKLEY